jgi:hypothetical protein
VIERCGWQAALAGWKINSDNVGVSDPAHVELTPMPMVNNTMVSVDAAFTMAFAAML